MRAEASTIVSVAMGTCNGAAFLEAQLDSISAQTRPVDELVVGDDASSDATPAILEAFAARARFPVRITLNPERLGVTRNFSGAIARCRGDLILLSDQDDEWRPDKVERLLARRAARPRSWLTTHDAAIVDGAGGPTGLTLGGQIAAAGRDPARDLVAGCCMALDARLARFFDPPPPSPLHDTWASVIADLLGLRDHLPESLIDYRRHGGNVSQSYMSELRRSHRWALFASRAAKARAEPVRERLRASATMLEAIAAALERHREVAERDAGADAFGRAQATIAERLERDRRRLAFHALRGSPKWRSFAAGVRAGDYRGGDGLLRLVRDLTG